MAATGHDYDVLWAISKEKQTNYTTKLADEKLVTAYPFKGPDIVQVTHEFKDDADEFGKGHEFLTRLDEEFIDAVLTRNFDMTSWMAGWVGAFGLGTVSSEQQGVTGAYKHTSKFSDPDTVENQNPVTTIVEDRDGIKRLFESLAMDSFTVAGKRKERVALAIEAVGSGKSEASTLSMPSPTVGKFLRFSDLKFEVGPSASLVDESARVKSFEVAVANNLLRDQGYIAGCGKVRKQCLFGKRTAGLKFTLLRQGTVEKDHIEANDLLKAVITLEGEVADDPHKHSLIITFKNMKYRAIPVGYEDGFEVVNVECQPFYTLADTGPMLWETINLETSYLT